MVSLPGPSQNTGGQKPLKIESVSRANVQCEQRLGSLFSSKNRKRKRGRPPTASTSKKARTDPVDSMYHGKLSDFVVFNGDGDSTDSDKSDFYYFR